MVFDDNYYLCPNVAKYKSHEMYVLVTVHILDNLVALSISFFQLFWCTFAGSSPRNKVSLTTWSYISVIPYERLLIISIQGVSTGTAV